MPKAEILNVGDTARVRDHGDRVITRIDVCLRPSTDSAGEDYFANVDAVEIGEHGPPIAVVMEGGAWAYGTQIESVVSVAEAP